MKKLISLFLVLLFALALATPAMADPFTLLNWTFNNGGCKVEVLDFSIMEMTDSDWLRVNIRAINNTGFKLWIRVSDARIDGMPVISSGRSVEANTDSGTDDPLALVFFPGDDSWSNASEVIHNARTVDMTLALVDHDSYKTYYEEHVSFDLINSKAKPNGGLDTTYASDYATLSQGSKGEAVKALQQRLTDLGYLNDKVDGSYGKKTSGAVRSFCYQNDLPVNADATPDMQALLFSNEAKSYIEPWIPLIIGPQCNWEPLTDVDTFFFKVQVVNTSKTRTIKGFELSCYTTDLWGKQLMGDGVKYTMSTKAMVGPGEMVWSDSFNLANWYSTDTVWVGISRIVFDDGEVRDVDNIHYYECLRSR